MCDEALLKLQVIDAGLDAVLAEIYSTLSQGYDAKPLCVKLCPLMHVKAELMQQFLFLSNEPLLAQTPAVHSTWQTHSWRSEPWRCSNSDAPHCQ